MNIRTKGWLAAATALGTIALISAAIGWANIEVHDADHQRRQTAEIARALNDLRLVTFEYILHRSDRAQVQEREASARLDRLLANAPFSSHEAAEVLADLREHTAATHRIFEEFLASSSAPGATTYDAETTKRFEAQLSGRLLVLQQESLTAAFRLTDYSSQRINAAQQRVVVVIAIGLALIAITTTTRCCAALMRWLE